MNINITLGQPKKLSNNVLVKASAYIGCDYDAEIVAYLKGLSTRAYDAQEKSWEIPSYALAEFINSFPLHDVLLQGIYTECINKPEQLQEIPDGYKFKTEPFKHQLEGIQFGLTKEKFLLCDDQGLGKTHQIINWAQCLAMQGKIKRTLIICGVNSLKYNWQNEIQTHSNAKAWVIGTRFRKTGKSYEGSGKDKLDDLDNLPDMPFLITNIETLRSGAHKEGNKYVFPFAEKVQQLIKSGEISAIAFDECHKAKNPVSQQGRALLKLSAPYMVAMSGTPLMNNPLDLYVPLHWLGHDGHSFYAFKNHYCTMGGYGGSEIMGYKNLEEIREKLDTVMLRRLKTDVLDLPEKMHSEEFVEMTPKQAIIYKEALEGIRNNITKISFSSNPLAMLIKLRQATGYTGILSDTIAESAKLDRMEELVEELTASGGKAIIMSNWEQMTKEARDRLKQYEPAYITGTIGATERMNEVTRFQTDDKCKVIIGTIGAMGTGLTLTAAQTVIFLDEPWNRALKDQAEDRAHRIGTKGTVNIITLMAKNTIDEKIHSIVYKKGLLADMLVDGKGGKVDMSIINELLS